MMGYGRGVEGEFFRMVRQKGYARRVRGGVCAEGWVAWMATSVITGMSCGRYVRRVVCERMIRRAGCEQRGLRRGVCGGVWADGCAHRGVCGVWAEGCVQRGRWLGVRGSTGSPTDRVGVHGWGADYGSCWPHLLPIPTLLPVLIVLPQYAPRCPRRRSVACSSS